MRITVSYVRIIHMYRVNGNKPNKAISYSPLTIMFSYTKYESNDAPRSDFITSSLRQSPQTPK